ncbi:Resolvase, N terminal domain [Oribacterium sp. KHPX15]|uniref:recombinase family protein n=1 Tax=Oribacterium sp. KHPX15 TaxID=1855342 RepID=UPI000894894A|nr:recombinase family protein [Oribacterium sp. KHPX15]SEA90626.1 Resolvase, N terminal domain [Oribacterium sp. KHPX15]
MIYGYAHCSTNEERQDIDRQKRELYALGVTDDKYIYWEYESGTKDDRSELQKILAIVTEGDTIATPPKYQGLQDPPSICVRYFRLSKIIS